MRSLKVEYTVRDFGKLEPSKSFFRELSKQITPQILCRISDEKIRNYIFNMICLSLDENSYKSTLIEDGIGKNTMYISALYDALRICSITVFWKHSGKKLIYPWKDVSDVDIEFWVKIDEYAVRTMNRILPELYHPVIKSSQSGLPFDYQIHYASEGRFIIYPKETFSENDRALFNQIMNQFFDDWNLTHDRKIHYIEETVFSKKRIVFEVDFGSCLIEDVESMIYNFKEVKNIKKIVWLG